MIRPRVQHLTEAEALNLLGYTDRLWLVTYTDEQGRNVTDPDDFETFAAAWANAEEVALFGLTLWGAGCKVPA